MRWCIAGEFNSIGSESERKGVEVHTRQDEMGCFKEFMSEVGLVDLPLIGQRYTWYKPDGTAMSRLDRFLLLDMWLESWPQLSQWGMQRGLRNHYPIVLKENDVNWGPKPFRMLNFRREILGYVDFVKENGRLMHVEGWEHVY